MRPVPGEGPFGASMLVVGEGPGATEVIKGAPFQGRVGYDLRRRLKMVGMTLPTDVRFNNVIPYNIKLPKEIGAVARIVKEHWRNLEEDLETMRPRVILAVGRAALYRLTGKHKIMDETGGVWHEEQVAMPGPGRLPPGCVVVACLHPASVMRTKIGAGWLRVHRAVEKAAAYANGLKFVPRFAGQDLVIDLRQLRDYDDEELDAAMAGATDCSIDTEFTPDGVPYLVGLTVDGTTVYSFRPTARLTKVMQKHMLRKDLTKIAHYHPAEISAFRAIGVDTCFPWWDSLEGFSHLYPDLPVGLAHVGLYYQDGYHNHKGMEHADPMYNAIDVKLAWDAKQREIAEMSEADPRMLDTFLRERMPVAATFAMMADRGLKIDQRARKQRITKSVSEEAELLELIKAAAEGIYGRRTEAAAKHVESQAKAVAVRAAQHEKKLWQRCAYPKHGEYTGLKSKKFSSAEGCVCKGIFELELSAVARADIARIRKEGTAWKGKIKRWADQGGFNPGNNDHVKWLLYDSDGLKLRKQYKQGKLTANADAINKLSSLQSTKDVPGAVELLNQIKGVQHLRKLRSTFYFATEKNEKKIDERSVVHPPMRAFGTGTGRPAGGADEATDAKKPNPYAFNIMNIPDECRRIYIPHDERDLVGIAPARATKEEIEDLIDRELNSEEEEEDDDGER